MADERLKNNYIIKYSTSRKMSNRSIKARDGSNTKEKYRNNTINNIFIDVDGSLLLEVDR